MLLLVVLVMVFGVVYVVCGIFNVFDVNIILLMLLMVFGGIIMINVGMMCDLFGFNFWFDMVYGIIVLSYGIVSVFDIVVGIIMYINDGLGILISDFFIVVDVSGYLFMVNVVIGVVISFIIVFLVLFFVLNVGISYL